jgi:hypothetical protein
LPLEGKDAMAARYLQERALSLPEKISRVAETMRAAAGQQQGATRTARTAPEHRPPPETLDDETRELLAGPSSDTQEVSPAALAALVDAFTPELVLWLWGQLVDGEIIAQEVARTTTVREDIGGKVIVTRLSAEHQAYARRTPLELLVHGLALTLVDPLPDDPKPHGLT